MVERALNAIRQCRPKRDYGPSWYVPEWHPPACGRVLFWAALFLVGLGQWAD